MKEESRAKTGRKPKSDPADYKYSFRLNAGENMRFEKLVTESEAKDKTRFIKKAIFGGTIKVVKIDKATMDYYIRLTEFHKQFQAVGNNYNQVVRAIRSNFGEKRAMSLLYKLEKMTLELMLLNSITHCPECGSKLIRFEGEAAHYLSLIHIWDDINEAVPAFFAGIFMAICYSISYGIAAGFVLDVYKRQTL